MKRLNASEVHSQKIAELGLDRSSLDLESTEGIAGALRRAAGLLCPCAAPTLVRGVVLPLRGLVDDIDAIKARVESTLEAMIAHGDILEHRDVEGVAGQATARLLYAAPAGFVVRESGTLILLGVASDHLTALPEELAPRIDYVSHLRRLRPAPDEDLRADLRQLGLIELSYDSWLNSPAAETPSRHVARLDGLLDAAEPSRDVPGLSLLDPERSVRYYPARWVEPRSQSGRFVARRSQAYGADLWSYVQLRDGHPERLVDLPIGASRWRGCDEAWRLQMALDANRGEPQRFKVRMGPAGTRVLEFFSPLPMWARRRLDAIGEPLPGSGCLFAYRIPGAESAEELRFAREALWLGELSGSLPPP